MKLRPLYWSLALIALVVGGALWWGTTRAKPVALGPRFTTATVTQGPIRQAVLTTGQLTPLISVEVSTQISGLFTEVNVDFNTPVKRGQILARVDPSTYEQKLKQAEADLAAAEAGLAQLRLSVKRNRELRDQEMVSQSDYDQIAMQLQQAEASLLTRKAAVEAAKVDLDRCTLVSPIDGTVIYKAAQVGKTVQASFSAPTLFVIAEDLHRMQIIASIGENDILKVKAGQAVTFSVDPLPGRQFHGRILQLRNPYTPSDKQSTGGGGNGAGSIASFDAVIQVENPDLLLLPSLTAMVSIIIAERENVIRIPNAAVRFQMPHAPTTDSPTVYGYPSGDRDLPPEAISVKIGMSDSLMTEIVSGLKVGDTVVTGIAPEPFNPRPSRFGLF